MCCKKCNDYCPVCGIAICHCHLHPTNKKMIFQRASSLLEVEYELDNNQAINIVYLKEGKKLSPDLDLRQFCQSQRIPWIYNPYESFV